MRRGAAVAWILAAAIATAACGPRPPANQPRDPLFEGLDPPPLNRPAPTAPPQGAALRVQEPRQAGASFASRGGRTFSGVLGLDGAVTLSAESVVVTGQTGEPLVVRFRLPTGLAAPAASMGTGSVSVVERSDPAGADRRLVVRVASRTLLGHVWQRSTRPLDLDLGNGVRITQRSARGGDEPGYADVVLEAFDGNRPLGPVVPGRVATLDARAGRYLVYSDLSHLLTVDTTPGAPGLYLLRAWIVFAP